jgi:hypothetical protein
MVKVPPRSQALALGTYALVVTLLAVSLLTELALAQLNQNDINAGWQAITKQGWLLSHSASFEQSGQQIMRASEYAKSHAGVSVLTPCFSRDDRLASYYLAYLNGGVNQTDVDVVVAACRLSRDGPLGTLPTYLKANPQVAVNAIAIDEDNYEWAVSEKNSYGLPNLTVVRPLE